MLKKTLETPLDSKEIKPVNSKGNQSWIFIGMADAEVETLTLWPPDGKSWFIGKAPDAGQDWGPEKNWVTEDKMLGWHHWLNGHEFEQTRGDNERHESLMCCSSWGRTQLSDWTTLTYMKKNYMNKCIWKKIKKYMYLSVHSSIIYNCQDTEQPKCKWTDRWINKMWHTHTQTHTYNGILFSH